MSRWKDLPDSLDDSARQLVVHLRRLKDRGGLSLSSLAAKTGYSRSSWERYLNGKALPPRQAVEELARVSGTEPTRLLVLHEVAAEAWGASTSTSASAGAGAPDREQAPLSDTPPNTPPGSPPGTPEPRRVRPKVLAGAGAAAVVAAVLVGLLVARPWDGGGGEARGTAGAGTGATAGAATARGAFAYRAGKTYSCTVTKRDGRLYAGYSTTSTAVLSGPAWDVVEAQCLLKHQGFDPGAVDGVYGDGHQAAGQRPRRRTAGRRPARTQGAHGPEHGRAGERTPYSKSSWERYLNGKLLAPRGAVEALCRMAQEPPGRLVALWELADLEWSGRSQGATRPSTTPAVTARNGTPARNATPAGNATSARTDGTDAARPDGAGAPADPARGGSRGWRGRRWRWVLAAAAAAVCAGAAVWALTLSGMGRGHSPGTAAPLVGCHRQGCAGKEPGTMGCGRPGQVRDLGASHETSTGAGVEIRYNPACGAAWARMWHARIGDALVVSAPGSASQRAEVTDRIDAENFVVTHMVDGGDRTRVRACFVPVRGGEECFHG